MKPSAYMKDARSQTLRVTPHLLSNCFWWNARAKCLQLLLDTFCLTERRTRNLERLSRMFACNVGRPVSHPMLCDLPVSDHERLLGAGLNHAGA